MRADHDKTRTSALGLFSRRERWGLTLRGIAFFLFLFGATAALIIVKIHPFLAITAPVASGYLVVEGWIPEYAIRDCAMRFKGDGYKHILTVGGPVRAVNFPAPDDDTYAYVARERFAAIGVDRSVMQMVPAKVQLRDRTYSSAVSLRDWLHEKQISLGTLNVVTLGPHARRTRLLFEKAFGPQVQIGVVSIQDREYDPRRWWSYSEGVKEVISEGSAYLYARFLFAPHEEVHRLPPSQSNDSVPNLRYPTNETESHQ